MAKRRKRTTPSPPSAEPPPLRIPALALPPKQAEGFRKLAKAEREQREQAQAERAKLDEARKTMIRQFAIRDGLIPPPWRERAKPLPMTKKQREKVSESALRRCVEAMVATFGDKPPSRDRRWENVKAREPGATYREWQAAERRYAPQWQRQRGRPRK